MLCMHAFFLNRVLIISLICKLSLGAHTHSFFSVTRRNAHTRTVEAGDMVIRMRHEASAPGHQLTEVGLGSDGAQEVSHCPAAEPGARVLQPPPPLFLSCFSFLNSRRKASAPHAQCCTGTHSSSHLKRQTPIRHVVC